MVRNEQDRRKKVKGIHPLSFLLVPFRSLPSRRFAAGQTTTEFILMVIFLTFIGIAIMTKLVGTSSSDPNTGSIKALQKNATQAIVKDGIND